MGAKSSSKEEPRAASVSRSATNKTSQGKEFGLPRCDILRGKVAFAELFQQGRHHSGRFFSHVSRRADGPRKAAFGTVRTIRSAVIRNRIKRRLREAYRLERHSLPDGIHLCFIGNERTLLARLDDLREQMAGVAKLIEKTAKRKEAIA